MTTLTPKTTEDLGELIATAARAGTKLELRGGGSKADIGAPREATIVDMRGFNGITDYDPRELVLTAGAGTPLSVIEAALAEDGQMLAFEPWDHGGKGAATLGGIVAAGVSGPQRISQGATRDHVLGFTAVSGRGERFVAGGKVVKNVTGYDLSKLITGSWGRLAALTEITLKVLPAPRVRSTLMIENLSLSEALAAMADALGSAADVAAAAHLPASLNDGRAMTLLRLQGIPASVEARTAMLENAQTLPPDDADLLWAAIRNADVLNEARTLWRISAAPSRMEQAVAALGDQWFLDWGGALLWVASEDASAVHAAATAAGGHATLTRAPADVRARIPMQQPRSPGVMALEARVRHAFDPAGVFETGRFLDT